MRRLAILGSTSNIAREYLTLASTRSDASFDLYSRRAREQGKFVTFLKRPDWQSLPYEEFGLHQTYDAIINFVGCGDPKKLAEISHEIISINEGFDNLALRYIAENRHTKYIYLSSGASHLSDFSEPICPTRSLNINLNHALNYDPYSIAKFVTEVKHRSLQHWDIIDLRVFNYLLSANIETENSLIGNVFKALKNGTVFITDNNDVTRDYVNDEIFYNAVECALQGNVKNAGFDLYSKSPASKFELLQYLTNHFSFKYAVSENMDQHRSITGVKPNYYSKDYSFSKFGYNPGAKSIQLILSLASKLG